MDKTVIGTTSFAYPEKRNFAGLPFEHYTFKKVHDWYKLPSWLYFKLKHRSNWYLLNSFNDFGLNNCRLYHFFNVVSHGRKPWICTFETYVPRWTDSNKTLIEKGFRLLADPPCKQLIALSQCTADIQLQFIEDHFPSYRHDIESKMQVLHPPQPLLINDYQEKPLNGNMLVFTIVGADFFRKGGSDVLAVFRQLIEEGHPVKLNIVSAMNYGDYASKSTRSDYEQAMALISAYPENFSHFSKLGNAQVMDLLKESHAALLPTMAETYGYSVLEAQAAGCPVITTNIRAMPETNNDHCGWLIPVAKDNKGNAVIGNDNERRLFSNAVREHLYSIIRSMLASPSLIREKGHNALKQISLKHNPSDRVVQLEHIYREALI